MYDFFAIVTILLSPFVPKLSCTCVVVGCSFGRKIFIHRKFCNCIISDLISPYNNYGRDIILYTMHMQVVVEQYIYYIIYYNYNHNTAIIIIYNYTYILRNIILLNKLHVLYIIIICMCNYYYFLMQVLIIISNHD